VVVQGLARGRVVVAADQGGPAEVIRSGHDGLLYRMGDEEELTRAMDRVAAGAPGLAAMRDAAVRTTQEYHPERTAERLTAALERVVGVYARA
jgi:glycosyltransferase involved in cell wall biosynthesis